MPPKFIFFDLGNVVLKFSHEQMCRQIGELLGADGKKVYDFVFAGDENSLMERLDAGKLSGRDFYEALCEQFGTRPDFGQFCRAIAEIFEANGSIFPVITHLAVAGYRMGLLSNTNELHWQWILKHRYGLVPGVFDPVILSFELKVSKPSQEIFKIAAEKAGVAPEDIFYTDDTAGHVEGARSAGLDAVQYTGTTELVEELRKRGVVFNY